VGREAKAGALSDLAAGLLPQAVRRLEEEIGERLANVPSRVNEYGYDPYGLSPEWLRRMALPGALLYRYWFRCRTFDVDRLPAGRMLLVANHAGQLPFDGAMLASALLLDAEPPRVARPMGEYFIPRLPFLGVAFARGGAMVGTPANCAHMLQNEECVMVFPEGVRGISKPYRRAYQLQRFGLGFLRLALATRAPVVPVGIVGSEEQAPALANLEGLARRLGLPSLPVTPTFPWLGPLGAIPLPVRYRIYFGEPLVFEGDPQEEDGVIREHVEGVRREISALLQRGLEERGGIFT
jgi:1-acyl-sn-glycerol-3-phosphate acyltransferase